MVEGSVDIQVLVAVAADKDMQAVYIAWMCASTDNNKLLTANVRYLGVGGHLFAIAAQKSVDSDFGGFIYGFAANQDLLKHYAEVFNDEMLGALRLYHLAIDEANAKTYWKCMTMNGQMKKYRESLINMPEPILLSQITQKMNMRGLIQYAKEKGVKVAQLTESEKRSFLK